MLQTLAKLEKKIGDKTYQFLLDADSKLEDAKTVLYQFLGYIGKIEEDHKAQQVAKAATQTVPTEAVPAPIEASVENNVVPLTQDNTTP